MTDPGRDPVNDILDELVRDVHDHFRAYILALTSHDIGKRMLSTLAPNTAVTKTLGVGIEIEPIPVSELQRHESTYPEFVADVFHARLVHLWQEVLNKTFAHYVDLHLKGERVFKELGTAQARLDFRNPQTVVEQVRISLCQHFEFQPFNERQKLINKARNPADKNSQSRTAIHRHAHIRNAVQHHRGVLHEFMFKELGCQEITLLDEAGNSSRLKPGDKATLSFPEVDNLKSSLLVMAQTWKTQRAFRWK